MASGSQLTIFSIWSSLTWKPNLEKIFPIDHRPTVERVPVGHLLLHVVRARVVVQVDQLVVVAFDQLGHHQAVRKVSGHVLLRPTELVPVDPAVDLVQLLVRQRRVLLARHRSSP